MEMQVFIGQGVGNWRLTRLLGEGAFGAVYEAVHVTISGRLGAVKILRPELSMQRDIKQRFLNEASAASRAEHENIVQVFDGGIAPDGTCYQVMELLRGQPLSKLMHTEKRLDAARAINIAAQIAAALGAAHSLGVVHRDLKPDNVFVVPRTTNTEFVKVLDFGVAKLRGDPTATDDKLTSTGMIIGTAPYVSPEQWQSRPDVDGRADIYALGVILFEMLAGVRPYSANTAYEWIVLHMEASPPNLQQYGVSPQITRVVRRMLTRQPELRQQTMREVIQDLRTCARGLKNVQAFSSEGTQLSDNVGLPTHVAMAQTAPPTPAPPTPSPPTTSYQPTPTPDPAASHQQTNYQQPSYQPTNYQQPNYRQPNYQQPSYQPTSYQPPQASDPGRTGRLRRLGEFTFGTLIVVVYLIFNWTETMTWFRGFLHSLRFGAQ